MAAAEELAKMNMADITEEKAEGLKGTFEALGARVGKEDTEKRKERLGVLQVCW